MDCRHFDSTDWMSGIAAAEADLDVVGIYANEIQAQGKRALAVDMYRRAMLIRDLDMVINSVLLLAWRSLEKSSSLAVRRAAAPKSADMEGSQLQAIEALRGWLDAQALEVMELTGAGMDAALSSLEIDAEEFLVAELALGGASCTVGLSTLPLSDHVAAFSEGALIDCLTDLQELAQDRHRAVVRMHQMEFTTTTTHEAAPMLTASTEGMRPC